MNTHGLTIGYLCDNNLNCEESNYNINKSSTFLEDPNKKYYSRNQWSYIVQDSFTLFSVSPFFVLYVQDQDIMIIYINSAVVSCLTLTLAYQLHRFKFSDGLDHCLTLHSCLS